MNKIKLTFINIFIVGVTFGQVGIGTTTPDESAALDISTISKGVLFPTLSNIEINAIQNPSISLFLYNRDLNSFTGFDGSQWTQDIFFPVTNWDSRGNVGTIVGNYIGTSNNLSFNVRTNNNLAMSISTNRQVSLNGTDINNTRLYIASSMPNTSIPALRASNSNGFGTTPFPVTLLSTNIGNGSVTGTYAFSDSMLNAQNGISLGGFSYVNEPNVSGLSFYIGQPSDINDRSKEAMMVTNLKNIGIGVHEPKSRLHLDGDFYISNPSSGIIIRDSGNNCRRITVDDLGALQVSSVISCP